MKSAKTSEILDILSQVASIEAERDAEEFARECIARKKAKLAVPMTQTAQEAAKPIESSKK